MARQEALRCECRWSCAGLDRLQVASGVDCMVVDACMSLALRVWCLALPSEVAHILVVPADGSLGKLLDHVGLP